MNASSQAILQDVVRREGRSLLQYVSESFPWTTEKNQHALAVLLRLVKEEQEAVAGIVRLMIKRKVRPPYLGAYPTSFTTINYISLDHLLPLLIDYQNRGLRELEREGTAVDDAEARAAVASLIEMKRRHLQELNQLSPGQIAMPTGAA